MVSTVLRRIEDSRARLPDAHPHAGQPLIPVAARNEGIKFRENFEIIRSDVLRARHDESVSEDKNQVITSVSWVSRIDDAKDSLLRSHWDLIIVDEAHKMSAASADKKTLAYELGEQLSQMTDHFLLMTATPHKGDPENFFLPFPWYARPGRIWRREKP